MSAESIIAEATKLGITLEAGQGVIRFSPRTAMTSDLAARIATAKSELLALLGQSGRPSARPESGPGLRALAAQESAAPGPRETRHGDERASRPQEPDQTANFHANPHGPHYQAAGAVYAKCRCGSSKWRFTAIHSGQSLRRDCAKCRQFMDFPVWYGEQTTRPQTE